MTPSPLYATGPFLPICVTSSLIYDIVFFCTPEHGGEFAFSDVDAAAVVACDGRAAVALSMRVVNLFALGCTGLALTRESSHRPRALSPTCHTLPSQL